MSVLTVGPRVAWSSVLFLACGLFVVRAKAIDAPVSAEEKWQEQQSLFERLHVLAAWKITRGDPSIIVGVIDNGFDFFHPDLVGQLTPGFYAAGGYHTQFYEGNAHGTYTTSLIVAKDDGLGMAGLAPHCRVLTAAQGMIDHKLIKMQREYFRTHEAAAMEDWQAYAAEHRDEMQQFGREWVNYQVGSTAESIRYLVDHGVRVINISSVLQKSLCQSDETWSRIEEAFAYAATKDVVIVLAAGNNAVKCDDYPGQAETVLVAGALVGGDTRWEQSYNVQGLEVKQGSNYGRRLSVMAPVDNLLVCCPHEEREYKIGDSPMGQMDVPYLGPHQVLPVGATSCAAPIVSSLAALVLSVNPEFDAPTVVRLVEQGCDDLGEPGVDTQTGHGRVNFARTLDLAKNGGSN